MQHFLTALQHCRNGQLDFNLGNTRAFLYGKHWYPLRATINYALQLANEPHDITTDRALVALAYSIPYIRVADIQFDNHLPVEIDETQVIDEVRHISNILSHLL